MSTDMDIIEILSDWNFWFGELYTGIERKMYIDRVSSLISPRRIVAVIGVRRAGKSFILRQVAKKLSEENPRNILLVNFEDPRLGEQDWKFLDRIFTLYLRELKPREIPLVILDEVQRVREWERWVRMVSELGRARIIVSGSSSKLMSPELATLLTGRHSDVIVFPLSFEEFIRFKEIPQHKISLIKAAVREYIEFGGFPEVVLSTDKKSIVLGYFDDIIYKDILLRFFIDKPLTLRELARYYMTAVSKPVTYRSIERFLGINVETIEKYTSYLETAMLIFLVHRYSPKIREQIKAPRKVYAMDVAFPNIIGFRITRNIGQTFENLIAIDLMRLKNADPRIELYYWCDQRGKEVDFVLKLEDKVLALIEATYEADSITLKEKGSNLVSAARKLGCENIMIITYDTDGNIRVRRKEIPIISYWRWALTYYKRLFSKIKGLPGTHE